MIFNNRCALITGAAAGIGLATARNLAAHGVRLVLTDVNSDGLDKAVAELRESGAVPLRSAPCFYLPNRFAAELPALPACREVRCGVI